MAHFLKALGEGGHDEEESHGAEGREAEHGHFGLAKAVAPCASGVDAGHAEPGGRNEAGDDIGGPIGAVLQSLQNLADGAAIIIGGFAGGADGQWVGIGLAPYRLVVIEPPRKVLRVVDLGHARGLSLASLWREVQGFFYGGQGCVRSVRVDVRAHHGIDPRTQGADAVLHGRAVGIIRGFGLYRHVKPPHLKRRICRRKWRLPRETGVAV